jgi:hypothetical protein
MVAAVLYGIVHDLITTRICIEYFTIGHPRIIESRSPTALAFTWGVVATWWMGLILGVPIALAARVGRWPRRTWRDLVVPLSRALLCMGIAAFFSGTAGCVLARRGEAHIPAWFALSVPADRHVAFITALWAHNAAYMVGAISGVVIAGNTLLRRREGGAQECGNPALQQDSGR